MNTIKQTIIEGTETEYFTLRSCKLQTFVFLLLFFLGTKGTVSGNETIMKFPEVQQAAQTHCSSEPVIVKTAT